MKNLIIVLMIVIFFSCEMPQYLTWDEIEDLSDFKQLKTLHDIKTWINLNIKYKSDNGEFYQYPQETLDKRSGDCEDFSSLFCAMANKILNKQPMLKYYTDHVSARYNEHEYFHVDDAGDFEKYIPYENIGFEIEMHRF